MQKNMTMTELGKRIGFSKWAMLSFEKQRVSYPMPLQYVRRIAYHLNVPSRKLFSRSYWNKHYYIKGNVVEDSEKVGRKCIAINRREKKPPIREE